MAREQRKDVDYFPHSCTHGRKMHIIESLYGNDGYAVWFKLLEQLGKANNHYIDIGDEMNLMFLASKFNLDEEQSLKIINSLAKVGAIDKQLLDDHSIIWSEKFVSSIEDAWRLRKNKLYQKSDIIFLKTGQSSEETPQSSEDWNEKPQKTDESSEVIRKEKEKKVNKSKVKESREKDQSENQRFSPPSQSDVEEYFSSKINETFWNDAECKKEAKKFVDFYTSKNWYVGKNKMKIWKSAASGWINRKEEFNTQKNGNKNNGRDNNSNQNGDKDFGEL